MRPPIRPRSPLHLLRERRERAQQRPGEALAQRTLAAKRAARDRGAQVAAGAPLHEDVGGVGRVQRAVEVHDVVACACGAALQLDLELQLSHGTAHGGHGAHGARGMVAWPLGAGGCACTGCTYGMRQRPIQRSAPQRGQSATARCAAALLPFEAPAHPNL